MSDEAQLPRTASEALSLWDRGAKLEAFEVENEGALQSAIYAAAFELMREASIVTAKGERSVQFTTIASMKFAELCAGKTEAEAFTKREQDAAHSIAYVAVLKGYAVMVKQHLAGGHIRPIIVKKT